jgi:hypothetical protein
MEKNSMSSPLTIILLKLPAYGCLDEPPHHWHVSSHCHTGHNALPDPPRAFSVPNPSFPIGLSSHTSAWKVYLEGPSLRIFNSIVSSLFAGSLVNVNKHRQNAFRSLRYQTVH